jgi:hypothetical protein
MTRKATVALWSSSPRAVVAAMESLSCHPCQKLRRLCNKLEVRYLTTIKLQTSYCVALHAHIQPRQACGVILLTNPTRTQQRMTMWLSPQCRVAKPKTTHLSRLSHRASGCCSNISNQCWLTIDASSTYEHM